MAGSPPNLHTMDSRSACIQGVLKVKVKVKVTWYEHFCAGTKMASSRGQMAWSRPNLHMIVTAGSLSLHPGCSQGQGQRSRDTRTFLDSWNELLRHWRPGYLTGQFFQRLLQVKLVPKCNRLGYYGNWCGSTFLNFFPVWGLAHAYWRCVLYSHGHYMNFNSWSDENKH